ncbi:PQQ-like beta-propeller repeat protein [Akkermansiaceae bacterium]|nr:PQQ-like beta-propeller repeat protein [Akkermansiaceae bacterium]MDB4541589.1 PQQ-like beta-propeller repeat protein [Akkermansiaceae bacterium]
MKPVSLFSSLLLISQLSAHAERAEWSSWRGPNGNGSLSDGEIQTEFSADGKGLAWKTPLTGRGCSTPVVAKGQLLLTAPVDGKDSIFSYDLKTGAEKWRLVLDSETPGRGQRVGSGANSSVATDGEHAVAYFKSGRVVGAKITGEKLWEINLQEEFGETTLWWDQGTSPVAAAGNFVVAVMQTEGESYLVSLSAKTGEVVWKTERNIETQKETGDSYTTPNVVTVDGVETIISFGANQLTGHDAKTGKLLWNCAGQNPDDKGMWRTIASSVHSDGVVVIPHARGEYSMGVKIGGKGDVTKSAVLWRKKIPSPDSATPVARDGKIYQLVDSGKKRGTVLCLEAKTGKELWKEKLPRSPSVYYASPILVGNQLCFLREDGAIFIAEFSDGGLGEVTEQKVGEALIASPIFEGGSLILRSDKHLWCIR